MTVTCVLVLFFHLRLTGNPMSRLLTVFALTENGSLKADAWGNETEDKAVIDGHTYSDKAPLSSFLLLPFYGVWRAFKGPGLPPNARDVGLHLGNLVGGAIPFAAFLAMLWWRLMQRGDWRARSTVPLALLAGFGSVLFNYGNAYFGHMLAATCFLGAWVLLMDVQRHFVLAGCLISCAVLAEYPTGMMAVLLTLWVLLVHGRKPVLHFIGGALPGALSLGVYNFLVTGNPLKLSYSQVTSQWEPMKTNYGMRLPDPVAVWELMFGQFRGMLFYAPALLVLLPLWLTGGDVKRRRFGVGIFVAYWLLMSAYFKWDGGWCTGPRHLVPVIALAFYEGAIALQARPRTLWMVYLLSGVGLIINLAAASTDPIVAENHLQPFFSDFWPRMARGELTTHNLAVELGLPNGRYLIGVWLALFAASSAGLAWLAGRLLRTPAPAPVPLPDGPAPA